MAHTRRLSARHGLPLLTLIFIGAAPLISAAQNPSDASAETEAAPIVIDMAAPLEPERAPPPPPEPSALGVYRNYIESMEASAGAFAPGLTEQLLGLGLNLQALERHAEAATVLKRGVHVSRVQSGLYAPDQIPLLKGEIRSLIALQRFDEVDERQRYLARVESEALEGTPASIAALLDQGAWAEQAWELRLGEQEAHPEHLARSWEYYRLAYNQSSQLFGNESMELLKPLEGMLRLQYRFAEYQRASQTGSAFDGSSYRQTSAMGGAYRRGEAVLMAIHGLKVFNGVPAGEQARDLVRLGDWASWMGRRADSKSYYEQAWNRITPPPPSETPDALTADETAPPSSENAPGDKSVADGNFGESSPEGTGDEPDAVEVSDSATALAASTAEDNSETLADPNSENAIGTLPDEQGALASSTDKAATSDTADETGSPLLPPEAPPAVDDPVMRAALFETVTPLPDIDALRPLPPFRRDATGPLVVQFQLNEVGKITELERLNVNTVTEAEDTDSEDENADDTPTVNDSPAVDRLLRKMRRLRFRPRYEDGVAVETGMIVWSFDLDQTGTQALSLQP